MPESTSLTLSLPMRYKRVLVDPVRLCHMMELACRRLKITPEQLWKELETDGDLADLESGANISPSRILLEVTINQPTATRSPSVAST